ncbi:hypothetical protein BJV77DRAFT_481943 [Russula vinacea]|nr:hypothetical protein BJV77DRAFT_481943 [Russula vinacea]
MLLRPLRISLNPTLGEETLRRTDSPSRQPHFSLIIVAILGSHNTLPRRYYRKLVLSTAQTHRYASRSSSRNFTRKSDQYEIGRGFGYFPRRKFRRLDLRVFHANLCEKPDGGGRSSLALEAYLRMTFPMGFWSWTVTSKSHVFRGAATPTGFKFQTIIRFDLEGALPSATTTSRRARSREWLTAEESHACSAVCETAENTTCLA